MGVQQEVQEEQQEGQQEEGQQEEGQQEEKVSNEAFNQLTCSTTVLSYLFTVKFSVPFIRTVTRWESYNMCTDDLLGKRRLCIQIISVTVPFRFCCDPKCMVRI